MADFNTTIDVYMRVIGTTGTSIKKYGSLSIERYITKTATDKYDTYYKCKANKTNTELPDTEQEFTVNIYNYTTDTEESGSSTIKRTMQSFWVYAVRDRQAALDGYGGYFDTRITVESELFCNAEGNSLIAEFTDSFELTGLIPDRAVKLLSAPDFTDESNLTISIEPNKHQTNYVASVEAVISFNDLNRDIVRALNVNESRSSYTFQFTDAERALIRSAITQGTSKAIKVSIINTPNNDYVNTSYPIYYSSLNTTVALLNALPVLEPVVEVLDSNTKELTGKNDTFIKYYSYATYSINAYVGKSASITKQQVKCLNQTATAPTGTIANVESGIFEFSATDNRNNTTVVVLEKPIVEYVKLTCNQHITYELSGETGATARVVISGNYFNDTFGAADNELILEMRHTQNDGTMGDWVELTDGLIPEFNDNTYSLNFTISGFEHYDMLYTFQCRARDKCMIVESSEYTTRVKPIFDWGESDFNFNVPVTIQGGNVYGASILSDSITDGVVTLNDAISNYKYLEIYYTDNNGRGAGLAKVLIDTSSAITVDLALIEASSATSTYIRRTAYICSGNKLTPATIAAGYVLLSGSSINHTTGKNYLMITRVLGYK